MIQLNNIHKNYYHHGAKDSILQALNLTINKGEIIALLGPSGIGKSTLLRIIGLIDTPCTGDIFINNISVNFNHRARLNKLKRQLAFVFQDHALLKHATVIDNIVLPLRCRDKIQAADIAKANRIASDLGIANLLKRPVEALSGGQKQRVAIARALITTPDLLLCDEPTSALDHENIEQFTKLIHTIRDRYQLSVVLVTHDRPFAEAIADTTYDLSQGQLQPHHNDIKEGTYP